MTQVLQKYIVKNITLTRKSLSQWWPDWT